MPRSLGRASLVLLGGNWAHSALGLLISVLIGRGLGPAAVGALALNLGLASVIMAALLPGFTQAHLKRLAEGQDTGSCVGTMLAIQAGLTALLLPAVLGGWWAGALGGAPADTAIFLAMLGTQVASRLGDVFLKVLVTREWVLTYGTALLSARIVRLLSTALLLALAPSLPWIAATFLLEAVLSGLVAAGVLLAHGIPPRRPTRASLAHYWRYARPFLVTTPIALVQDSIDRVLVGRWAGLTAAGYYHVARGLWEALAGVMAPPGLLMFTRLSALYAERTPDRDRQARILFFSGLDKLLFVSTALAIVFWTLAPTAIALLYGASFVPATATLRILIVTALVATLLNSYTFVLQAQDEVARFVLLNIGRFAVYLAALAVLIPGVVPALPAADGGAALARLLLVVFPAWVWIGWTRELAGIPFYRPATVYLAGFALAVATFHAVAALLVSLTGVGAAATPLALLVGAGVYALWLLKLHPGTRANFAYTLALVAPGLARRPG
jgi:O-antigen/teichoic acid export membrane protein